TIHAGNEQVNPVNLWESSVRICPPYGELQPYEELPMKLRIRPRLRPPSKGFINNPENPPSTPFALCVRVHIVEPSALPHLQISTIKIDKDHFYLPSDCASCPSPEILITGRVVPVQVSIEPSTEVSELKDNVNNKESDNPMKTISVPGNRILMDFGQCIIGKTRKMKFCIRNRSAEIPLAYFLPSVAHFHTSPSNGHIPPNDRVAIDVAFNPKQCGAHSIRQQVLLLDDCQLNDNAKSKAVIFKTYLTLCGSAVLGAIKPTIKFNPGTVPLVSNEVGFGTDIMRFGSNLPCPRVAVMNQGKTLSLKGLPTHAHQEWRKLLEYRKPHSNTDDFKCPQVAFPNDRATSLRPTEEEKLIRTIFCRLPRYTYLDRDYQLSESKLKLKVANTQFYAEWIRKHTEKNIQKRMDTRLMPWQAEPHHGFIPLDMENDAFCIAVDLIRKGEDNLREGKKKHKTKTSTILTAEDVATKRLKALEKIGKVIDATINAAKEKAFTEPLSANELYQVSLSPNSIDFGDLCRGTTKTQQVQLNNPTNRQFLVKMEVEDKTLCDTSLPIYVVKPLTTIEIPVTVQCHAIGRVQYNANFSISGQYYKTVLITANGVPHRLEVNPSVLELDLTHFQSRTNKGCVLRTRVELFNPLNVSTAFSWEQINEDASFSIHCDKGTVEPFSNLVCEVVHHPSFNTPKKQTFRLKVHDEPPDNNIVMPTLHNFNVCEQVDLLCVVKLPPSVAVFAASNLSLGSIAYALPVKRIMRINSVGNAPAFCRISVDDKVKPKHSVVQSSYDYVDCSIKPVDFEIPAGGHVDLEVVCTPYSIGKFEKIVVLHGRGGRKTSCCISGTVMTPQIRSSTTLLQFNGVYVGGSATVPLEFENCGPVEAVLTFNLSKYPDFRLLPNTSPDSDSSPRKLRSPICSITQCASGDNFDKLFVNGTQSTNGNSSTMENELNLCTNIQLSPGTKWNGHLRFSPTDVAVYDFSLPVKINNVSAFQEQSDGSVTKHCSSHDISHRVLAIGLRQPVDIYPVDRCVQFNFPLETTPGVAITQQQQSFSIKAVRDQPIFWTLDLNEVQRFNKGKLGIISIDRDKGSTSTLDELIDGSFSNSTDEERFTIRFSPRKAGCFILHVPLLILKSPEDVTDGKTNQTASSRFTPFTNLKLIIRVTKPSIRCSPSRILLPPVPPDFEICFPIELVYQDLPPKCKLSVCWCAHDQTTPTECKQITPSRCPFVIDIPHGQNDGASTIIKATGGRLLAWFRLKSTHDGLIIRPHPKPCSLVFVVQPDENVNSKSSSPLIPSAARVAVPVSLAVDRSFLSWLQYIDWYPEDFDATISSLPRQGKIPSFQGDSHVHPSANEMQLKANKSTSIMKSGLLADFRTVDKQRHAGNEIDPHEMLLQTPLSSDGVYKEKNSTPRPQLSGRKSIVVKHCQSATELAEGIFGRHWQYCDRRTSECVRRWIQNQNFPGSTQMLNFPDDFRKCASFTACLKKHKPSVISDNWKTLASGPQHSEQEKPKARTYFNHNIGLLYQFLVHLCGGTAPPGVQPSISLNTERPFDAMNAVYSFHSSLLTFVNSQGGCLPHVVPQHLMDPQDYEAWHALGFPGLTKSGRCIRLTERSLCDPRHSALSASIISKRSESKPPVSPKSGRDKTPRGPHKQSLLILPIQPLPKLTRQEFESVSIRAWTDLMLQLIKASWLCSLFCFVVERLEPNDVDKVRQPFRTAAHEFSWTAQTQFNDVSSTVWNWLPEMVNSVENGPIKPEPSTCLSTKQLSTWSMLSRCSNNEAAVLYWVNYCYQHGRQTVWSHDVSSQKVPVPRLIGNFDTDFSDGVVLACLIGSYVPSLIPDYISKVYTQPKTDEQRLHNAIQIITALDTICLDYGLLPSDIINPHPLEILLLCVQLFRTLPDYNVCQCVQFSGPHQVMCKREIILTNPSSSPLTYKCFLLGQDAVDFAIQSLHSGNHLIKTDTKNGLGIQCVGSENNQVLAYIPANSSICLGVTYRSRFLRTAMATLFAVCQSGESISGRNLSFALVGNVNAIGPASVVDVTSPCYTAKEFSVPVCNPYEQSGTFNIAKFESEEDLFKVLRDFNHKPAPDRLFVSDISFGASSDKKEPNAIPTLQAFFCRQKSVYLCTQCSLPKESDTGQLSKTNHFPSKEETSQTESLDNSSINMIFLPLELAKSSCCLLFRNEKVGEFFVIVRGYAGLPKPSPLTFSEPDVTGADQLNFKGYRLSPAIAAACFGRPCDSDVIYLRVPVKQTVKETLLLPLQNKARNDALAQALRLQLETSGQKRTEFLSCLSYTELLDLAQNLLALPASTLDTNSAKTRMQTKQRNRDLVYEMEVNLKSVKVTSKVEILGEQCESGLPVHIPLDLEICTERTGLIPAEILVRGPNDIRAYRVECLAVPDNAQITFKFSAPVHQSVVQAIPINNQTNEDWHLRAEFTGAVEWFSGPNKIVAPSKQVTDYIVNFVPYRETTVAAQLNLINTKNGIVQNFLLNGSGLPPKSQGQLKFSFQLDNPQELSNTEKSIAFKQNIKLFPFSVKVPNPTSQTQHYKVESTFPAGTITCSCEEGTSQHLVVFPGQTTECSLYFRASKSGSFSGILAFVSKGGPTKPFRTAPTDQEESSDDDLKIDADVSNQVGFPFRIWYELVIDVDAGPPVKELEIVAPCLSIKPVEIPFSPLSEPLGTGGYVKLEITLEGAGLHGSSEYILDSSTTMNPTPYRFEFRPAVVGDSKGSITFFHPLCGEFWVALLLRTTKPEDVHVQPINCELGKSVITTILLENHSDEPCVLAPHIGNTEAFALQMNVPSEPSAHPALHSGKDVLIQSHFDVIDPPRQERFSDSANPTMNSTTPVEGTSHLPPVHVPPKALLLEARSTIQVGLKFTPFNLGTEGHEAVIRFLSKKLIEWRYFVSGCGVLPKAHKPVYTYAEIGSASTVLVPISNPFHNPVCVDVLLTQSPVTVHQQTVFVGPAEEAQSSPVSQGIGDDHQKGAYFTIPIAFEPKEMRQYSATCSVVMRSPPAFGQSSVGEEVAPREPVEWVIPLKGIAETTSLLSCTILSDRKMDHAVVRSSSPPTRCSNVITGVVGSTTKYQLCLYLCADASEVKGSLTRPSLLPNDRPATIEICPLESTYSSMGPKCSESEEPFIKLKICPSARSHSATNKIREDKNQLVPSGKPRATDSAMINKLLESSVQILLERIGGETTTGSTEIQLILVFTPSHPFKCTAQLTVATELGGIWKFAMRFEAKERLVDDVVILPMRSLGKTTTTTLSLASESAVPEPFVATLSPSNNSEFKITPQSGLLPTRTKTPEDKYNCQTPSTHSALTIALTPIRYGKQKVSELTVETPTSLHRYQLIGDVPCYIPPTRAAVQTTGKASDALGRTKLLTRKKRNFILHNQCPERHRSTDSRANIETRENTV
ncbi:hypothetical protein X801_09840, partial [Opisthorchis viverrini]